MTKIITLNVDQAHQNVSNEENNKTINQLSECYEELIRAKLQIHDKSAVEIGFEVNSNGHCLYYLYFV